MPRGGRSVVLVNLVHIESSEEEVDEEDEEEKETATTKSKLIIKDSENKLGN